MSQRPDLWTVLLHGDGGIAVQEPKPRIALTFLVGFSTTGFMGALIYALVVMGN